MEIRNLGHSGLRVSAIGLGCNNLGGRIDLEVSRRVVGEALDAGLTLFDVADIYGRDDSSGHHCGVSEEVLGDSLGAHRHDIVLATKFGALMDVQGTMTGASRR